MNLRFGNYKFEYFMKRLIEIKEFLYKKKLCVDKAKKENIS